MLSVSVRYNRSGGLIVYKENGVIKTIRSETDLTKVFSHNKLRAIVRLTVLKCNQLNLKNVFLQILITLFKGVGENNDGSKSDNNLFAAHDEVNVSDCTENEKWEDAATKKNNEMDASLNMSYGMPNVNNSSFYAGTYSREFTRQHMMSNVRKFIFEQM